jgi:hypothetical protein
MLYLDDICDTFKDKYEINVNITPISIEELKIWSYLNKDNLMYSSLIDKKIENLLINIIGFIPEYKNWQEINLIDVESIAYIDYNMEAYAKIINAKVIDKELAEFISKNMRVYLIDIEA